MKLSSKLNRDITLRKMNEIEKIISRDNRRLVKARKTRDGTDPNRIFIEGRRLVAEALRSGLKIEECFVAEGFRDPKLLDGVREYTDAIAELPERIFASVADTKQPQGIILIAKKPEIRPSKIESRVVLSALPLVIFLNKVNNPSNLGAILRTAEAVDVAGVIVSKNSADTFSPKALRAAMGASFRVPVWENVNLDDALKWAKAKNLMATASDISGGKNYDAVDWKLPRMLIFGSEAHGLDDAELDMIAEKIQIPMANDVESLNLAVSAGIILFEAKRQNS